MAKPAAETQTPRSPILTKDFVLLFAVALALFTGMNMLNVAVPLFVIEDLGGNTAITGLLSSVYTLSACLMRPLGGVLSDRLGRRSVMVGGCALFCAASAFCGAVPVLTALFLGRILQGVGYSTASTANNTASTDVIPQERMAEGIGYFGMSQSVAGAIGPALASVLIGAVGNRNCLFWVAGCGALGVALSLLVRYESRGKEARPRNQASGSIKFRDNIEKTAILPSVVEFFSLFCLVSVMCFFTPYLKVERGFDPWVAGAFFAVSAVTIVVLRLLFSRFVGKCSHLWFLLPSFGLMIALCFSAPFVTEVPGFLLLGAVYGASHGLVWMAMGSEAVRHAPPERRGMANATFYLAFDAAIGLGAATWGILINAVGYDGTYRLVAFCFAALSVAVFFLFRPGKKRT